MLMSFDSISAISFVPARWPGSSAILRPFKGNIESLVFLRLGVVIEESLLIFQKDRDGVGVE